MNGFFGDEDTLLFEIELITSDGLELPVDAMFDTGFSYWLAINSQDLDVLNWVRLERQIMRTARGDCEFNVYAGKIKLDGQQYDIPVPAGKDLIEVLLSRKWLDTRQLLVNMQSGILTL